MIRRPNFERLVSIFTVAVASIMAIVFFGDRARDRTVPPGVERIVANWEGYNMQGLWWVGERNAQVVITEFIDFECRHSAAHAVRLDTLLAEFGSRVAVVFHHFPLTVHGRSFEAAVASECAARQDRLASFRRAVLAQQDSIGVKSWTRFGEEIGIPDVDTFARCVLLPPDTFPRIGLGRGFARETGATGTPTVWVNGRILRRRDLASLRQAVGEVMSALAIGGPER